MTAPVMDAHAEWCIQVACDCGATNRYVDALRARVASQAQRIAALTARLEISERQVTSWRWAHWSATNAPWVCECGDALGHRCEDCEVCGMKRPRKGSRTAAIATPRHDDGGTP